MESCPIERGAAAGAAGAGRRTLEKGRANGRCAARPGIALAWTAIVLLVMVLMVGLSIDWGKATWNAHQLQNAADAAALAGAQWVKIDRVVTRDRAQTLSLENYADQLRVQIDRNEDNLEAGDLVIGRFNKLSRTFTATLQNPSAVKVVARRIEGSPDGPVHMIFGYLAGVDTIDITREAIARSTGATGAGLICLDPNAKDTLRMSGGIILDVNNGDIQVNSTSDQAATVDGGSGFVDCDTLNVCGEVDGLYFRTPEEELPFYLNAAPEDEVDPIPDPLAKLEPPDYTGWPDLSPAPGVAYTAPRADGQPFEPGYYSGGFRFITPGQTLQFNPGVYVVEGQGLYLSSGDLFAYETMFYIAGGALDLTGNNTISITPPVDGTYKDVTFFQSRENLSEAKIIGGAGYHVEGILYFPKNPLEVGGTAGTVFKPGDQLICATAWLHGNCTLQIQYDGRNVIEGFRSLLVK